MLASLALRGATAGSGQAHLLQNMSLSTTATADSIHLQTHHAVPFGLNELMKMGQGDCLAIDGKTPPQLRP